MSKEDIGECKTQIQAGISSLQLSLQLVNLQATYIAPQLANRTLLEKLEDVQKLLAAQNVDKRLQECADTYLSRGATLYEKSVASSIGDFQHYSRPKAIAEWLEQLDALRLDGSASPSLPTVDDSYSSPSQALDIQITCDNNPPLSILPGTQGTATTSHNDLKPSISKSIDPNDNDDDDDDDDDEDEFAMEMVQAALDSGRDSYRAANYQDAEDRLGECLALIRKLSKRRRRGYDIEEIHLLLALCAFHIHESATAEAALVSALDFNTGMNAQTDLYHTAAAALAIVYVRLNKYEPARFTCENVYKGRRKLLGKDNDLCFESLALLAIIHDFQELPTRANTYRSMIPKEKQSALHETFCQLTQPKPLQVLAKSTQGAEPQKVDPGVDGEWMVLRRRVVFFLAISATAKILAYSADDVQGLQPTIELRKLDSCKIIRTMSIVKEGPASNLEFDHQGKRLFSGHGGAWYSAPFRSWKLFPLSVRIWNIDSGQCLYLYYDNSGGQDNLQMTTLRYSPKDERLIFTYQVRHRTSMRSKAAAKLRPGFIVLDGASGTVVHQKDFQECRIRNFSEDFSQISLQTKASVKTYEVKGKYTVAVEDDLGVWGLDRKICSLYRSDGSLLSLLSDGRIRETADGKSKVWLEINLPNTKIWYAWMGVASTGRLVIIFTILGRRLLYIAVPELNVCKEISDGVENGNLALDASQGAVLWAVSEDSKYLAYGRSYNNTDRIQVLDLEEQIASMC